MPIQQNPNKRRGEERSETLIIPHITREMLEVARAMAEKGREYTIAKYAPDAVRKRFGAALKDGWNLAEFPRRNSKNGFCSDRWEIQRSR